MAKKLRMEPPVRELAEKLNAEFKRVKNMIPDHPDLALVNATLKVLDDLVKEKKPDAKGKTGKLEALPIKAVDQDQEDGEAEANS